MVLLGEDLRMSPLYQMACIVHSMVAVIRIVGWVLNNINAPDFKVL